MNRGERAITIDEVDLDWCFQPGVKLDCQNFPDGYVVTAEDVEHELGRIGHQLKAARDRRGEHPGMQPVRQQRLRHRRLRHGLRRNHVTCSNAAFGLPGPTPGAGMRTSSTPRRNTGSPAMRSSSGRGTRRGATSATATWRNCIISRRCRRQGSRSPVSRSRSAGLPRAGRAQSRSSTM